MQGNCTPRRRWKPGRDAAPIVSSQSECRSYRSGGISLAAAEATSRLSYTSGASVQSQTAVKLNRVFFPRRRTQARSLGCGFAR